MVKRKVVVSLPCVCIQSCYQDPSSKHKVGTVTANVKTLEYKYN